MRFRLAGFPVEIHPSFFILAVLLGLGAGDVRLILLWVAVVFVSILTHELGHAIVGRSYGLQPQIRLYSMGGVTSWSSGRRLTPRQSILVSLAGPAAGLALGGILVSVLEPGGSGVRGTRLSAGSSTGSACSSPSSLPV